MSKPDKLSKCIDESTRCEVQVSNPDGKIQTDYPDGVIQMGYPDGLSI